MATARADATGRSFGHCFKVPNERTRSMNRYGFAVLAAALVSVVALGSSALAQAPQPAGPATTQAPAPGSAPRSPAAAAAQPPRVGAAPAPASPDVRRQSVYRTCFRAAKRRGLRGAKRRAFVTRCRIGRESITR